MIYALIIIGVVIVVIIGFVVRAAYMGYGESDHFGHKD